MADLEPITRDEMLWSGEDVEPITRREMYIRHLYDETQVIPERPITREEMFILKAGEELHDVTIEQLNVSENGTYSESGKAYSPVIVEVPLPSNAYLLKDLSGLPADIATFTDGSSLPMPKLEVDIEPIQDLHGYDAPWVGGAGKNKFNVDYYGSTTTYFNRVDTTFINKEVDSRNDFRLLVQTFNNGTFISESNQEVITSAGRYSVIINIPSTPTFIRIKHNGSSSDLTLDYPFTQTGQYTISLTVVKTNPSTVGGLEFKDIQIESGSTATTYAPYSNICPISGWSAVDVTRTGKNLFDVSKATANSAINASGQVISGSYYVSDFISVKPNTSVYLLNIEALAHTRSLVFYGINKELISIENVSGSNVANSFVKEIPNNVYYIRIGINPDYINNSGANYPSTDTEYHAYNGQTYIIQLGDTYYGAKLDVVSGVLTVDRAEVDLGDFTWTAQTDSQGQYFRTSKPKGMKAVAIGAIPNAMCSIYQIATSTNVFDGSIAFSVGSEGYTFVRDTRFTDATAFKSAVTGQKLVYELATPIEIQLTPTQVNSLEGVNNISANSGKIINGQYFSKGGITI